MWVSWGSRVQFLSIGLGYSDKKERVVMIDNCAMRQKKHAEQRRERDADIRSE